jgi:hypothetical protein
VDRTTTQDSPEPKSDSAGPSFPLAEAQKSVNSSDVPDDRPTPHPTDPEALFEGWLRSLPAEPRARLEALAEGVNRVHPILLREVERALNDYLAPLAPRERAEQRRVTRGDKERLVEMMDGLLNRFGAAVAHEGRSCAIYTTSNMAHPRGQFVLTPLGTKTQILARANLCDLLPLRLLRTPPDLKPHLWVDRVSQPSDSNLPPPPPRNS